MNEQDIQRVLAEIKRAFIDIMKSIDLDNSTFVKDTKFEYKNGIFDLVMPYYAIYIDEGRGKNKKQPPVSAMVKFIRENNIRIPKGSTEESLAFGIAKSIGQRGIKRRPFLERLQQEVSEILTKYIYVSINEELMFRLDAR